MTTKHDDEILLAHLRGSDILFLADRMGRGDELRERLTARVDAFDAELSGALDPDPDPRLVDDGDDTNGRELAGAEPGPRANRGAGAEPELYELTLPFHPGLVMLRGPAFIERAAYEAFIEAGGTVETRGFSLDLRGESLEERELRIARERRDAAKAERIAAKTAQKIDDGHDEETARAAAEETAS